MGLRSTTSPVIGVPIFSLLPFLRRRGESADADCLPPAGENVIAADYCGRAPP